VLLATLCLAFLPHGETNNESNETMISQQDSTETTKSIREGRSITVVRSLREES
jgi:hypothetical protein